MNKLHLLNQHLFQSIPSVIPAGKQHALIGLFAKRPAPLEPLSILIHLHSSVWESCFN